MDNPLVRLDPGLFIWTILTFLTLLFLLAKFAWKPLLAALEERENKIKNSLLKALHYIQPDDEKDLQKKYYRLVLIETQ